VQSKSFLFLFLFTFSLAAPIAMQCCSHSSDITSFLAQEEESKTDTFELETEKITEKVLASIRPLKCQGSLKKPLETETAYWNTIYTEPTAPPPQML
jgi:hypothetical protein